MSSVAINVAFEDFDPNNLPEPIWASYICGYRRSGNFKVHGKRGFACNAVAGVPQAKLFEFADGRWELIAEFNTPDLIERARRGLACETCRRPFDVDDHTESRTYGYPYRYAHHPYQVFHRTRGKLSDPLRVVELCGDCIEHGAYPV